jgi:hypothetical protein
MRLYLVRRYDLPLPEQSDDDGRYGFTVGQLRRRHGKHLISAARPALRMHDEFYVHGFSCSLFQYIEDEIYTPKEFMHDISYCRSNRVIVVADQSYGGELVAAADSRSFSLKNVVLFTSTEEFNFSASKDRLTHYLFRYQREDVCLSDLKNVSMKQI